MVCKVGEGGGSLKVPDTASFSPTNAVTPLTPIEPGTNKSTPAEVKGKKIEKEIHIDWMHTQHNYDRGTLEIMMIDIGKQS